MTTNPLGDFTTPRPKPSMKPPSLDSQVLGHGLIGEMIALTSQHTEADPAEIYGSLLCGIGILAGPTPHLRIGSTKHPLIIWPLLFGPTGTGRKGEASNVADIFLTATHDDYVKLCTSGLSSGEGLIEAIRDPTEVKRGKVTETVGTNDKRLVVIEPEFSSVMARSKREGNTLPAVMRQAWDGRALSVLNRTALRAKSSHVGIIGHVTPREFQKRLAESELAGGLYNRFLPLWVERSQLIALPEPIAHRDVTDMGTRIKLALQEARKVGRVILDDAAKLWWSKEVYPSLSAVDDVDAAWAEFTRRAAPYCLRIAALHAVLNGRSQVSRTDLEVAKVTVRFSLATAQYVLGVQHRDPQVDRLKRAVDASPEGLSRTDISRLFGNHLSSELLDEIVAVVLKDPDYELVSVLTEGRSASVLRRAKQAN
jgi:Protein of unknown function (DUF3987)